MLYNVNYATRAVSNGGENHELTDSVVHALVDSRSDPAMLATDHDNLFISQP